LNVIYSSVYSLSFIFLLFFFFFCSSFIIFQSGGFVGRSLSTTPDDYDDTLELPPFRLWYEPVTVLERAHRLPIISPDDGLIESPSSNTSLLSNSSAYSIAAIHIAYSFCRGSLIASITDERGIILHNTLIICAKQEDNNAISHVVESIYSPSSLPSTSVTHRAAMIRRLLLNHLSPILRSLPRTLFIKQVALVIVRLGSKGGEWNQCGDDKEIWKIIAHDAGWKSMQKKNDAGEMDHTCTCNTGELGYVPPVKSSFVPSLIFPADSAEISQLILLSFRPIPVPDILHTTTSSSSTFSLPSFYPHDLTTGSQSSVATQPLSNLSYSTSQPPSPDYISSNYTSPNYDNIIDSHTILDDCIDISAEISRAQRLLGLSVFNKSWWQTRNLNGGGATDYVSDSSTSVNSKAYNQSSTQHSIPSGSLPSSIYIHDIDDNHFPSTSFTSRIYLIFDSIGPTQCDSAKQAEIYNKGNQTNIIGAARVGIECVYFKSNDTIAIVSDCSTCGGSIFDSNSIVSPSQSSSTHSSLSSLLSSILIQYTHIGMCCSDSSRGIDSSTFSLKGEPFNTLPNHITMVTRMRAIINTM
jgi:hypothetical protein